MISDEERPSTPRSLVPLATPAATTPLPAPGLRALLSVGELAVYPVVGTIRPRSCELKSVNYPISMFRMIAHFAYIKREAQNIEKMKNKMEEKLNATRKLLEEGVTSMPLDGGESLPTIDSIIGNLMREFRDIKIEAYRKVVKLRFVVTLDKVMYLNFEGIPDCMTPSHEEMCRGERVDVASSSGYSTRCLSAGNLFLYEGGASQYLVRAMSNKTGDFKNPPEALDLPIAILSANSEILAPIITVMRLYESCGGLPTIDYAKEAFIQLGGVKTAELGSIPTQPLQPQPIGEPIARPVRYTASAVCRSLSSAFEAIRGAGAERSLVPTSLLPSVLGAKRPAPSPF
ncbi:MAG: hypothetical protein KBD64_00860 [Gammaproteobacteria bacterium]|nr:hypothetical protein [Gammaproteobacteria bacterium]